MPLKLVKHEVMKLLDKFRVKKWLTVLLATPDATCPAQRQAMARLAQIGRPAIPHLLLALGSTPTPTILIEFLTTRVNQASFILCAGAERPESSRGRRHYHDPLAQSRL